MNKDELGRDGMTRSYRSDTQSKWRGRLTWFAAELAVVVSGVLLALAIGSLYQKQQDYAKEERYLTQLTADLEQTEKLMVTADSLNRSWDGSIVALLGAYRGDPLPPRDSILSWVNDIQFDNPVPVMGTADALIETGDLQLIQNFELRSAVTSYLSRTREYNIPWLLSLEDEFVSARSAFRKRIDMLEVEGRSMDREGSVEFFNARGTTPYPLQVSDLFADRDAYFLLVEMMGAKKQFSDARAAFRTDAASLRRKIGAVRDSKSPAPRGRFIGPAGLDGCQQVS